jgi:hypothetical protein
MIETRMIWRFCLAALAVWRLTHLLAEEDGPWEVVAKVRARMGTSVFGRLMDCFYCLSLWVSLPLAVWLGDGWIGLFVHWQALSGAACLFQRMTGPSPAVAKVEHIRIETLEGEDELCAVVSREAY